MGNAAAREYTTGARNRYTAMANNTGARY